MSASAGTRLVLLRYGPQHPEFAQKQVNAIAINDLEAASCPLLSPVAAWPSDLAGPVLAWFDAVIAWDTEKRTLREELRDLLVQLPALLITST